VGVYGPGARASVVIIETTRPERTRSGVGIGSTQRALQRTLGASCRRPPRNPYTDNPAYPLLLWCSLDGSHGRPLTLCSLVAKCSILTGRHVLCPRSKRTYRTYEVTIASALGQRVRYGR
jgi:hypothetical protein